MGGSKGKVMSLFETNTTKDSNKPKQIKNVYEGVKKPMKPKIQKQSEDKTIKNIRNLFKLKKVKQSNQRQNN